MFDTETKANEVEQALAALAAGDEPQKQVEQQPQTSEDQSWFEIGGRKFDKESAKTKIEHSDAHIQRLEAENAQLRQVAEKLDKLEKLEQLLQVQQPQQKAQEAQPSQDTPALDVESLKASLLQDIQSQLSAKEKESRQQANLQQAVEAVKQAYGDGYLAKLEQIGQELDMSEEDITNLAKTNPKAFARMFMPKDFKPAPAPKSSVIPPRQVETGDKFKDTATKLLKSTSAQERTRMVAELLKS